MSNKVPLILYSGGIDSAQLVVERLKQSEVDLLVITSVGINRELHRQAELKARQRFYKAASGWYEEKAIPNEIRTIINVELPYGFSHHQFSQPPIWITTAFNYLDRHKHSSVEMTYVAGDQFAYFAKDVQKAWEMLWRAFNPGADLIPLKFPYLERALCKEDVMKGWEEYHYNLTWYCEDPLTVDGTEFYVCDHCPSCKRMQFSDFHKNAVAKGKCPLLLIIRNDKLKIVPVIVTEVIEMSPEDSKCFVIEHSRSFDSSNEVITITRGIGDIDPADPFNSCG